MGSAYGTSEQNQQCYEMEKCFNKSNRVHG
jgi:hypothetical protein